MSTIGPGAIIAERYELGRQLGAGGMARVYLARDRKLGRDVAVKVLAERYAADPAFVERFRREATSAAALNHPNIVSVYDRGEADGSYFIVMEYLPGTDLKRHIREHAPLPPLEAIDVSLQLLSALGAAHRHEVIHRDVKPQNVLFADDGRVKVTDFGIARAGGAQMTEVGLIIGTAQYLSPEQAQGREVTAASDCYSAGIVLYEMLTGRVPFDGDRPVTVALKQVNEAPVDPRVHAPEIPPRLAAIVMKALEKHPDDRYTHAEDFARALRIVRSEIAGEPETAVLGGDTGATRVFAPTSVDETGETRMMRGDPPARRGAGDGPSRRQPQARREPPPRRRRFPALLAVLLGLGLVGGIAFALLGGSGGSKVTVPDVVNKTQAAAVAELKAAEFKPEVQPATNSDIAKGNVISTNPPGNQKAAKGSTVIVTVSSGPDTLPLPDVTSKQREAAISAIEGAGFDRPDVVEEFDATVPKGAVIKQDPSGPSDQPRGTKVTLTVSKGPKKVAVPDLQKKSLDTARGLLSDRGLELGTQTPQTSDQFEPGTIIRQDPAPNASVPEGSKVNVVVAEKPDLTMPDIIGLTPADARKRLDQQGYNDNVFRSEEAPAEAGEEPGTIIDTVPRRGEPIEPGQRILITVAIAAQVRVPRVTGKTIADAQGILENDGFNVVLVPQAGPNGEPPGIVWGTEPSAGVDADRGSDVTIFAAPEASTTGTAP